MGIREIIFRGFCEHTKSWIVGSYVKAQMLTIKEEYEHFIIEIECDGAEFLVIPETVGQYTGLKDKNGTKIFEGDICLTEYGVSYDTDRYPSFVKGTQKKNKVEIKFVQDEIHNFYGFNFKHINDEHFSIVYEVIGNVHETEQN